MSPFPAAIRAEGFRSGVRAAWPTAEVAAPDGLINLPDRQRDRYAVGDDRCTVRCRITGLLGIRSYRNLFSQEAVRWGRVMRYGCYKPRTPFLLTGGVVASAVGRLLVAFCRFSDVLCPPLPAAMGRAVALAPVAMGADSHLPVASRTVEHPVALVDGSNSRQKELDATATVADTPDDLCSVASAMTQKPRPSLNGLGFTFFRYGPCLTEGIAGYVSVGRADGRTPTSVARAMVTSSMVASALAASAHTQTELWPPARCRAHRDPEQEPHPR